MSASDAEKGAAAAERAAVVPGSDPLTALDNDMTARRGPDDYESSISEGLEKKESLAARRKRTKDTTATDYDDGDDDDDTTAELSRTTTRASVRKAWYRRLNPLKRRHKPPVPQERTVSPESTASWWSLATFQWMAPLMRVSWIHLDRARRG